jgi:large subunit ribosomal protein L13
MATPTNHTKKWYVIDATDVVVGRLAVQISILLRGKHQPYFTPHLDTGDYVIVVNADKVKFTGNKWTQKTYEHYTGYPGGLKSQVAKNVHARRPTFVLEQAIKRMIARNSLGRSQMRKLHLYVGNQHPHQAQQPIEFKMPTK